MTTTPLDSAASPTPRWAVRAAHIAALSALPAGIWRLLLTAGYLGGYTEAGYEALGITGWSAFYVAGLSVATEALALLTIGLVRPWGRSSRGGSRSSAGAVSTRWQRSSRPPSGRSDSPASGPRSRCGGPFPTPI